MRRWIWLLPLAAVLLFFRLGSVPYLETSEARYAEIAREMVESGDYVTPRLLYIKHFHKPPLTYWATALAFEVGGVNDVSGRVGLALAALGILVLTARIAQLLFPRRPRLAFWSVLALLASPLYLALARALTTDVYLALFTLAAVYYHWRWFFRTGRRRDALLAGVALGLAALTKGPVVLLFFLAPWIAARLWLGRGGEPEAGEPAPPVRRRGGHLMALVPLALFLPWLIAVARANPGLMEYFLGRHVADRVTSGSFHRGAPLYFYPAVLFAGMLFWFTYYLGGTVAALGRIAELRRRPAWLLPILYTLVPLILFSVNASKLAPYLLPAMPFVAILAAAALDGALPGARWPGRLHAVNAVLLLGIAALLCLAPWLRARAPVTLAPGYGLALAVLGGAVLASAPLWWRRRSRLPAVLAALNVGLFLWAATLLPGMAEAANGFAGIARQIEEHARQAGEGPDYRIVSYQRRLPSLTFYTGHRVIQVPHDRETQFEDPARRAELDTYLSQDPARIAELMAGEPLTYLVLWRRHLGDLRRSLPDAGRDWTLVHESAQNLVYANR